MQEQSIEKFRVTEAYLGPCQLSMMDLLAKMVKPFMHNVVKWPNIL